jgi:hypothetical protein
MKKAFAFEGIIYGISTLAAAATLTTHVTQWQRLNAEEQNQSASQTRIYQNAESKPELKLTAAYRDGLYVAKLAQQRGEQRQPSIGRWATQANRDAFAAGYQQTTAEVAQLTSGN